MKKNIAHLILLLGISVSLSSCGFGITSPLSSFNQQTIRVDLNKKNFKYHGRISGKASANYIVIFGGLQNRSLLNMAKEDMYSKIKTGNAITIIDVTVEEHTSFVYFYLPLWCRREISVGGSVIEFTE